MFFRRAICTSPIPDLFSLGRGSCHVPMKTLRFLGALAVASLSFFSVRAAPASAASADLDWLAYENVGKTPPPKPTKEMSRLEIAVYGEKLAQQRREAALAFIEKHPTDPRRWELVLRLNPATPRFVKDWGPLDEKGVPTKPVIDEAAAVAWKSRVTELQAMMAKATDLPENTRKLLAEKTDPKPVIYHPEADATKQIADAIAEAKKSGRHVMVQVGGQWCIWCMRLHKMIAADAQLTQAQNDSYVVVHLNYSPENQNLKTLAELGYPQRFGFPVLVILDGDGKRLHTQDSAFLEEGDFHSKAKVMKFFGQWSPKAVSPATYEKKS